MYRDSCCTLTDTNVSLLNVKDLDLWEAELVKWENSSYTEDLEPSKEQVRRLTDEKKQLKSQISMLEVMFPSVPYFTD